MNNQGNIFAISVEWVQLEAEKLIYRRLNDEELVSVKKGIEGGLLSDIDVVFNSAIIEATRQSPTFDAV